MNRRAFLQRLAAAAAALPAYRAAALVRDFGVPGQSFAYHKNAFAGARISMVGELVVVQEARNRLLTPEQIARWMLEEYDKALAYYDGVQSDD